MNTTGEHTPLKIAIQGIAGCFHDAAAREYFAGCGIETVPFDTFPELFEAIHDDASMAGRVLDKARVFIVPGTVFGSAGKRYVRLSLCEPVNILEQALQRIESCL